MGEPQVIDLPTSGGGGDREDEAPDKTEVREHLILSGQPVRTVVLPSGKKLPIYPKPQAYFYKIEEAINRYLGALGTYEVRVSKRLRWPFKGWRIARRRQAIDDIEIKKLNLLRLVFADHYVPERNTKLTTEEFMSLPHDAVLHILEGYREANNVEDILKRLIPDFEDRKKKQDAQLNAALTRTSTRL